MQNHDETQVNNVSGMPEMQKRDDALFEALGKSRKRRKRQIIITIVSILLIAAVVLTVVVSSLQRSVRQKFASSSDDVLNYVVKTGTISTLVSGSGMLTNVDTEVIELPTGVELTEVLVSNGDTVEENQLLAIADMATVRSAMADLQAEIEDLDDQIADADDDKASTRVSAGVPGRLKIIYGEVGDNVAGVMVENGALAVISLDGYMALDLEDETLTEGDTVTVVLENGKNTEGKVESVIDGITTVLVTDDGPKNGEAVTVLTAEGKEIGSSELYVHSPLMVTGYAGTIRSVHQKENAKISKNMYLFTLQDTEYSANYDNLLRTRSESEETLVDLLRIQKYGGVTAPMSGSLYSVADLDAAEEEGTTITEVATLSPDAEMSVTISVDESDILALELGQETNVSVSSVSDEVFTGIVTEIDKTASDGAYTAVITLDKVEGMLPGMTADVDVKIQGVDNAILVPADALHYTSTGAYVYTTYDEETEEYGGRVDVVTGLSNDNYVEIVSGLSVGDTVYYTEAEDFFSMFAGMGMGGMSGGMGGNRGGSGMPSGGMPSGGFPGGGQMPSGGMPSGGQMPGRN